jgi:hypothetical protein
MTLPIRRESIEEIVGRRDAAAALDRETLPLFTEIAAE